MVALVRSCCDHTKGLADLKTVKFTLLALGLSVSFIAAEAAGNRAASPAQAANLPAKKPVFGFRKIRCRDFSKILVVTH